MKVVLNKNQMLNLAKNPEMKDAQWAKLMTESRESRAFFDKSIRDFNSKRSDLQMFVKLGVTVVLSVGLFLAAPSLLLTGAAFTVTLSNFIYNRIELDEFAFEFDTQEVDSNVTNLEEWKTYRKEWIMRAEHNSFTDNQEALLHRMVQLGLGLVIGFATFTAISSGMALPLALASVCYAATVFYYRPDNSLPYFESGKDNALPSLTKS